jgi:hypothetical protein
MGSRSRSAARRGSSVRPGRMDCGPADYEPEFPGESKGFGDGDLMGRVGPATLSSEEVVRRLVTLEFESFKEN